MSTNDRPRHGITDYSHPADDPAQIEAMRMALALRDMPAAAASAGSDQSRAGSSCIATSARASFGCARPATRPPSTAPSAA